MLFEHAWSKLPDGSRYAAITDPGTPLADLGGRARLSTASSRTAPTSAGATRCSPTSAWCRPRSSATTWPRCASGRSSADPNDAVELGWEMGRAAQARADKVTIVVPEAFRSFGLWVEQLIAESTGKRGTGCVPVPTTEAESGDDRHLITLDAGRPPSTWPSSSTASSWPSPSPATCSSIDPFDEPNVAESKANTNKVLDSLPLPELERGRPGRHASVAERARRPGRLRLAPGLRPLRPGRCARVPAPPGARPPGWRAGHRRLRPALLALDRPAAQGRPQHGGGRPAGAAPAPSPSWPSPTSPTTSAR